MAKRRVFSSGGGSRAKGSGGGSFGISTFLGLSDTPNSYTGEGGKVVVVKAAETGLEFSTEAAIDRHDVKASVGDGSPQFLEDKISVSGAIEKTTLLMPPIKVDFAVKVDNQSLQIFDDKLRATNTPVKSFFSPAGGLPVLPTVGDRYISSATANGWTIHHVYEWTGAIWADFTPYEGMTIINKLDGFIYNYVTLSALLAWYKLPDVDGATLDISGFTLFIKNLGITDGKIATANKDGTAATPSMRTLGTGAQQAAAGNHGHTVTIVYTEKKTIYNPSGITNTVWIDVCRFNHSATVTNVRVKRTAGTTATCNARRNGADNHLASDVSAGTSWTDGGAVQNTAYVAGDYMQVGLTGVTGSPTQVAIEVDLTRNVTV